MVLLETGYNDSTGKYSYRLDRLKISTSEKTELINISDTLLLQDTIIYAGHVAFLFEKNRMVIVRPGFKLFDVSINVFDTIPSAFGGNNNGVMTDMYNGKIKKDIVKFKYVPIGGNRFVDNFIFELATDVMSIKPELFADDAVNYGLSATDNIYLKGSVSTTVLETKMIEARFITKSKYRKDTAVNGVYPEIFSHKLELISTKYFIDTFNDKLCILDYSANTEYSVSITDYLDDAKEKHMAATSLNIPVLTAIWDISMTKTFIIIV